MSNPLREQLISNHFKLVEQLEDKYNNQVTELLEQKKVLIGELQNALTQQLKCMDNLSKQNEDKEMENDMKSIDLESKSIDDSELSNDNNDDPDEIIDLESKSNHSRSGLEPFKCDYCDKRYKRRDGLNRHIKTHRGREKKSFQCKYCDHRCVSGASLKVHVRVHTGERPFKCEHCEKRFKTRGNLSRHARIHTGEKPYECEHCDKTFNRRDGLVQHMRIHRRRKR